MNLSLQSAELTEDQFGRISTLVKRLCGINLHDGKKELVKARLNKRLRMLGMASFEEYIGYVGSRAGAAEITTMLDALSTNLTFFFREVAHFDHLRHQVIPSMLNAHQSDRRIRVWSAGCSSGEEPYSLAMTLADQIRDLAFWDASILATDLSTRVLAIARTGLYTPERLRQTPPQVIERHFERIDGGPQPLFRVRDGIRKFVHFARLNLMESWPMRGPFDVIFCRNVMIYFDKPTQGQLVNRFYDILASGGVLFIGHSESLTGVKHRFRYVQPTVYQKDSR